MWYLLNAQLLLTVKTVTKALDRKWFQITWRCKYVFSLEQNSRYDIVESWRSIETLFQPCGPAIAKARGPKVFVRDAVIIKSPCAADRRWRRPTSIATDTISSDRYLGATPWRHLYTKAHVLNSILRSTGSQWSSSRIAVDMWSYFRTRRTRRAAERNTDCNGRRWTAHTRLSTLLQ